MHFSFTDGVMVAVVQTGNSGAAGLEVGGEAGGLHAAVPRSFCRWRCIVSQM